jgi:hypothetical protein
MLAAKLLTKNQNQAALQGQFETLWRSGGSPSRTTKNPASRGLGEAAALVCGQCHSSAVNLMLSLIGHVRSRRLRTPLQGRTASLGPTRNGGTFVQGVANASEMGVPA